MKGSTLTAWIAVGDETGQWDIVDQRFSGSANGLAWLLGSAEAWDRALAIPLGGRTALEVFSNPIAQHLPVGTKLSEKTSPHYHLLDFWTGDRRPAMDVLLDEPQADEALDRIRQDLCWLLEESGLGVLAAGGDAASARASGLTDSGDGMRARALAYARLIGLALPFMPAEDTLNLVADPRSEAAHSDIHQGTVAASTDTQKRVQEPYRDFVSRLKEDVCALARHCEQTLVDGPLLKAESIFCIRPSGLTGFLSKLKGCPLLSKHTGQAIEAMKGMADLAAALAPRPPGAGTRFVVPAQLASHLRCLDYRELAHVAI